ncbi:calmodulin-binding protein 25-like [Curcuma longa]|uniref:calmodulin-binding protein 25-like n=1 Tax=Curcuma longa TaxID=136217 RepID=UPI003D9DDA6F
MLENCSALDPWRYRSDSAWISQAFASENQAVTRALQISLSDNSSSGAASPSAPFLLHHRQYSRTPATHPFRPLGPGPLGRVSKRRSRAPNRSPTTYINADPANFREMVQRVTGFQVDCGMLAAEPMVKSEPVRPAVGDRAALRQVCLSTLDTSALLLDCVAVTPDDDGASVGLPDDIPDFDLDGLILPAAFPTLESWDAI